MPDGHLAPTFVFGDNVHANYSSVEELVTVLRTVDAIPVAVGSGTINDVTKLAAHQVGRPYVVVATAASMDGYTAYGASITRDGSKSTFSCPAPRAVVADLDVICKAPAGLNASGYADMIAKNAAGGDWILADAAGVEAIDGPAWNCVQGPLRHWLSDPTGVSMGDPTAIRHLINGLMISGFAIQALQSSRPASGADHQFSHLWDMQNHTFNGVPPSHGFKVGIGTLASLALYEYLLHRDFQGMSVSSTVENWPTLQEREARIAEIMGSGELAAVALQETRAKHLSHDDLGRQLARLQDAWPSLTARLRRHLFRFDEARDMLRAAGCPFEPEQIGISRPRLRTSYEMARSIRRRYTVLDYAEQTGAWDAAMQQIFGQSGQWPIGEE